MHELIVRISFAKEQRIFDPVIIEGKEVEFVTSTKLLGLTIANDLTWNDHVTLQAAGSIFGGLRRSTSQSSHISEGRGAKSIVLNQGLYYIKRP